MGTKQIIDQILETSFNALKSLPLQFGYSAAR